jgi:hypothetical protein
VPRICEFYRGIYLTTEEKTRKNLSQGSHRQTIILQESEYIWKLKTIKLEVPHFVSKYVKNICEECKVKTAQKNEMHTFGWAGRVATMGTRRGAYRDLVERPEVKKPLGRRRWEDIIKIDLQKVGWEHGLD